MRVGQNKERGMAPLFLPPFEGGQQFGEHPAVLVACHAGAGESVHLVEMRHTLLHHLVEGAVGRELALYHTVDAIVVTE